MLGGFALMAGLFLLLSACSDRGNKAADESEPANPLLYEIAGSDGDIEGWLFGTIHALPEGTQWRTAAIESASERADLLMVEIADLADRKAMAATFRRLATTPGLPPLSERIAPSLRGELESLLDRARVPAGEMASTETWAAALILASAQADGDSENGVDRALIRDFSGRSVREFEGVEAQLAIFDALSEADQRDLLREVVAGSGEFGADPARLRRAWLAGDEAALIEAAQTGILADPGLRKALLVQRNEAWLASILAELERDTRPFVGVGAAHIVGPDGLATLLEAEGYSLRRAR